MTLTGTAAINATGNNLDNVLTGNSAANVLIGGAGADTLGRWRGRYSKLCDLGRRRCGELGGGDCVRRPCTRRSSQQFENLTGSNFDDTLEGNARNNILSGRGWRRHRVLCQCRFGCGWCWGDCQSSRTTAQNTITAGSDTLTGFENLTGSQFNDTLRGSSGNNVITGLAGNDRLTGAGGNDTFCIQCKFRAGHDHRLHRRPKFCPA